MLAFAACFPFLEPLTAADCEGLAGIQLPDTTISLARAVPAGTFTPPAGRPIPGVAAFCRVAGTIKPSSDSDIQFEVWMPAAGWNGKFQGVGNGGYAGAIGFGELAANVTRGYATASTDTGHTAGGTDAGWALDHPQKIVDFGYRAIHETADKAKAIITAFYGSGPKRSYFSSCSNGGRQALMEAQRFPTDYDGIIAGAPANSWTHLFTGFLWDIQALMVDPGAYIPAGKLPAIEAAALASCDSLDGLKDGVIDDPRQCRFDPGTLLCKGAESDACLTAPQVGALRKLYSGPVDGKGKSVYFGRSVGGETGGGGWSAWVTGSSPGNSAVFAFGTQFFANMIFDNGKWDYHTFSVERDMKTADTKMARTLNATDPDLKRFQARGGKLILYHGWSDAAIPPLNAIDYYQTVVAKMGAKEADQFVRLFMVPGMQHCGGGPGPNSFGQSGAAQGSPQTNIASALEQWVEGSVAPNQIVATHYKTGVTPPSVERTRPLCAFPAVARWTGKGSSEEAANFTCVKQDAAKGK
jgi:feruloyl esterase